MPIQKWLQITINKSIFDTITLKPIQWKNYVW